MPQTDYSFERDPNLVGSLANAKLSDVESIANTSGGRVLPGLAVTPAGALLADANSQVAGVVLFNEAAEQRDSAGTVIGYETGYSMPVLERGECFVLAETAVTRGGQCFVRHTASGANTTIGAFRADADSSNAKAIRAMFQDSGAAGDVVRVKLLDPAIDF